MRPSTVLLLCTLLWLLPSCRHKPLVVIRAFYYWKSGYSYLGEQERTALADLRAYKLYLKMFEVERNPIIGPIPVAKVQFYGLPQLPDSVRAHCELVPTVFINNEVLTGLSAKGIDSLADNISFLTWKYLGNMQAESGSWRSSRSIATGPQRIRIPTSACYAL